MERLSKLHIDIRYNKWDSIQSHLISFQPENFLSSVARRCCKASFSFIENRGIGSNLGKGDRRHFHQSKYLLLVPKGAHHRNDRGVGEREMVARSGYEKEESACEKDR